MSLTEIYWYGVIAMALGLAFIFSVWAFSGGWKRYMKKARNWADSDVGGAQFCWTVGLFFLYVGASFATFWAFPLYAVVLLGYLVSKGVGKRNRAADLLAGTFVPERRRR